MYPMKNRHSSLIAKTLPKPINFINTTRNPFKGMKFLELSNKSTNKQLLITSTSEEEKSDIEISMTNNQEKQHAKNQDSTNHRSRICLEKVAGNLWQPYRSTPYKPKPMELTQGKFNVITLIFSGSPEIPQEDGNRVLHLHPAHKTTS